MQTTRLVPGRNCLLYCPSPSQLDFHAGMGIYAQRGCSCGTGAGKTLSGLFEDTRWALAYPGSVGYIFSPSYPMMRRNIFATLESPLLFGCEFPYTAHPYVRSFNRGNMRLDWKNGSQWWFVSLEDPEKAEGSNIDYGHIDEARVILPPPKFQTSWLTIIRRLRGSGRCRVPMSPAVWITTTPDAPGTDLFNVLENPETKSPECRLYRWSIFDNPKLPKTFIDEIVRTHTGGLADRFIYGRFATVAAGTLPFDSSRHVREIDKALIKTVCYGVDFGWTNPSAIIANAFDGDGRGWAVDEFYKSQCTDEQLAEAAAEMQNSLGKGKFYCDKSHPQGIDKLKRAGFDARPYEFKREDGLRELGSRLTPAGDGLPRQFVSKRCVNLISELLEYRQEVKERDHACLAGDTLITTRDGDKQLSLIEVGDLVLTHKGFKKVLNCGMTSKSATVFSVAFSDSRKIVATGNHPLHVRGEGFVRVDALRNGFIVDTLRYKVCALKKLSTETFPLEDIPIQNDGLTETITDRAPATLGTELKLFIEKFGKISMVQFRKVVMYIIKTVTLPTMTFPTWNLSPQNNTLPNIQKCKNTLKVNNKLNTCKKSGLSRKSGTLPNRAENGINCIGRIQLANPLSISKKYVKSAGVNSSTNRPSRAENSVLENVKPVTFVSATKLSHRQPVYNLTVDEMPEFYANGILVHNCDALRYSLPIVPMQAVGIRRGKVT
jgi:hypothetical protein